MLSDAHRRAKRDGVPFALQLQDIQIPAHCPLLGVELKVGVGKRTDNSPTLDKIIRARGYVCGNVMVVSHRANRIKSDATLEELALLLERLRALWPN